LGLLIVMAGCGDGGGVDAAVDIVVTTPILGDLVTEIVEDRANVEVLIPIGVDPHDFQASSAQRAAINRADLVVANGLGLEAGLGVLLQGAASDGARIIELAPLLDPISLRGGDPSVLDPHVWMDPIRMADAARLISAELSEIDGQVDWASSADDYANRLLAADEQIENILSVVPATSRKLVTDHDTLGYFADRYGFEVLGTVIPGGDSLGEPDSAEMARLVAVIREESVDAIFAGATNRQDLIAAIAAEVGEHVEVVTLHTESIGEPGSGIDSLIDVLLTDARLVAGALEPRQ
jgi:zinc/manganese transport system substrate-binding protein